MTDTEADRAALRQRAVHPLGDHRDHVSLAATKFPSINSPEDLAAYIEESGTAFANFRAKHRRLWSTLENFISPICIMAGIAITPASVADFGGVSSAILGAVAYLVKVCEGVSDAYDWIEQTIQTEMLDFTHRLTHYLGRPQDAVLQAKISKILGIIFEIISRANLLVRTGRFRHYIHVMWLGKDSVTKKLVDSLNSEFGGEQKYTLAVTYVATQTIQESINRMEEKSSRNAEDLNTFIRRHDEDELLRRVLCDTTAHDDVEEIYARNSKALLKGSCDWLETEPFFKSWTTHQTAVLCIFGRPGTGKTYLSTWIVQRLLESSDDGKHSMVAYFFVKEGSGNLRSANTILKTLAWQIAMRDPGFKKHVAAVCGRRINIVTADNTWQTVFLDYYKSQGFAGQAATLVVDGLDEATLETRRTILRLLKDLVPPRYDKSSNIQFAIVGRPELRGDENIHRLERSCIIEVANKNQHDVERYIKKRLRDVRVLREMRRKMPDGRATATKFRNTIFKKVSEGADGVFLWARILLDDIVNKDQAQIETILVNPPPTLDDMIWHMFNRVVASDDPDQELVKKMLLFVTYARRPLLFAELYAAINLPLRTTSWLLWGKFFGKLSSIFNLKFPDGIGPEANDEEDRGNDSDSTDEDDVPSDNSDVDEDTERSNADGEALLGNLTERKRKTEISFVHARVRDYLEREGNQARRRRPSQSIIPANEDAHADFILACIEMFRAKPYLMEDHHFLSDYPICHLAFHLQATDINKIRRETAARILGGLYWLCGTDEGTTCLLMAARQYDEFRSHRDTFWQLWVETDENLKLLQTWFREVDALQSHSEWSDDAVVWMRAAAASLPDLLRPMMTATSKLWLWRPASDSQRYFDKGAFQVWLLHGWLTRLETGACPVGQLSFQLEDFPTFEKLPAERFEMMANWAGLDHDVHWHTLLGWTLMEGKYYKAAESHYHQAIELDPSSWVSLEGLAVCAGEHGRLREAISWQQKSLAALTPNVAKVAGWLWWRISDWAKSLGDKKLRYDAAQNGREVDDSSIEGLETYIDVLNDRQEYDKVLSTLGDLAEYNYYDYSLLARFFIFSDRPHSVGRACRKRGKPQFVLDGIDEARTVGETRLSRQIQLQQLQWMGCFIYRYYGLEEKAMAFLESFLSDLGRQSDAFRQEQERNREEISNTLAQLYFDRMVESWSESPGQWPLHADKLKSMAVAVTTGLGDEYEGFDLYGGGYPSMLWGRWQRDYLSVDVSTWKKCFRTRLLEEMKMLDDDDPTNDTKGLADLAVSLFHAGDRRNAGAILAILFTAGGEDESGSAEQAQIPSQAANAPSNTLGPSHSSLGHAPSPSQLAALVDLKLHISRAASSLYTCASCNRAAPDVEELHLCEICDQVRWCGECLAMLRGEERQSLAEHKCNPKHDFYRAWPVPEEARYGAAQSFENGVTVRRAWFEDLRREWLE